MTLLEIVKQNLPDARYQRGKAITQTRTPIGLPHPGPRLCRAKVKPETAVPLHNVTSPNLQTLDVSSSLLFVIVHGTERPLSAHNAR